MKINKKKKKRKKSKKKGKEKIVHHIATRIPAPLDTSKRRQPFTSSRKKKVERASSAIRDLTALGPPTSSFPFHSRTTEREKAPRARRHHKNSAQL